MNHYVTWLSPAPSCPIPALHPARHIDNHHTDVADTWDKHRLIAGIGEIRDDYECVQQDDWMTPGGFP